MKKSLAVLLLLSFFNGSFLLFAAGQSEAGAAKYPSKPIELTVGFAAGISADIIARKLASIAEKELGQTIVVVNRDGAGSALSFQYMAQQKPDGYSILWVSNAINTSYFIGNMPLTYKDFRLIAGVTSEQSVISVKADAPWKTLKEYVDDAKKRPGEISLGNGGIGSFNHLTAIALEKTLGVKFHNVPISGNLVPSILGGQINSGISMAFSNIPMVKSGEIRLLVSTGESRLKTVDNIPTLKELGYDLSMFMFRGFVAPKGTPDNVVAVLEKAFKTASESQEFKDYALQNSIDIIWMNGEQFTAFVAKDFEIQGELLQEIGLRKN